MTAINKDCVAPALDPEIAFVGMAFVDNAGIVRMKCCPADAFASAVRNGVGASYTFGVFTGVDGIAESRHYGSRIGDLRLKPDVAAVRHAGEWAWAPCDQFDQEGQPWPLDPRAALRRQSERASAMGFELMLAWELEYRVGDMEDRVVHNGPAYGANAIIEARSFLTTLHRHLAVYRIDVPQFHAEYAAGQLEFCLPPRSPVAAADEAMLARWAVHEAAHICGMKASFSPVVNLEGAGNGHHLHLSLWQDGRNLFGSASGQARDMAPPASAFMAGILEELPALVALGCAGPLSYRRLRPGTWSGAARCWGTENREAALRFIPGSAASRPQASNLEVKCFDPSGNPYLAAAATIAAGLSGIARNAALPPETTVDPMTLDAETRAGMGIEALPGSMTEAADALERSELIRAELGEELVDAIVAVRRAEAEATSGFSDEELIRHYRWRY